MIGRPSDADHRAWQAEQNRKLTAVLDGLVMGPLLAAMPKPDPWTDGKWQRTGNALRFVATRGPLKGEAVMAPLVRWVFP